MQIAIHHRVGSFSDNWIEYCQRKLIPYKIVNCYNSDIIEQLQDCDILLWHHSHIIHTDVLAAKNILFALIQSGKRVFPDFNTCWHFDDKVAQKYVLESIGAPLVPSHVFYNKDQALLWVNNTEFPIVFKLKRGAASTNVKLVRTKKHAIKLVTKAFGRGFSQFDRLGYLKERYKRYKNDKDTLLGVCKGIGRLFIPTNFAKMQGREVGYVYFQDFMPNNTFDTRIVVIGNKAIGEKRFVRKNDFRASGSGSFSYEGIDLKVVKIAFDVSRRLQLQSVAFDFIYDTRMNPLIVEMSYGFGTRGIKKAPGFWDTNLHWNSGKVDPEAWILDALLQN